MVNETDSLLGATRSHSHSSLSRPRAFGKFLRQEIDTHHGDLLLLACYIITGLLDSSAVFIWGSFVSMQTGNTVYFGLGLVGTEDDRWIKSGISICGFCIGSLFFSTFHRTFSPRKRWVLTASFIIQLLCITAAATIVTVFRPAPGASLSWLILVPIALVAFQSSGQAVASRALKFNGLTSVVLTSIYCDLFSHEDFLSLKVFRNSEELRRLGAVICLIIGVVFGGLWGNSSVGMMGALWTAVILKAFIVLAWLGWKKKED